MTRKLVPLLLVAVLLLSALVLTGCDEAKKVDLKLTLENEYDDYKVDKMEKASGNFVGWCVVMKHKKSNDKKYLFVEDHGEEWALYGSFYYSAAGCD